MAKVSPWLPDMPRGQRTCRDAFRVHTKTYQKKRNGQGAIIVSTWVQKADAEYLMRAWNLKNRSQLVSAALRHLMRQTQRGLTRLDGPPVGYD